MTTLLSHIQCFAGLFHTYCALFLTYVINTTTREPFRHDLIVLGVAGSSLYFLTDALYILLFDLKKQGMYLIHHAIAIGLYASSLTGGIDVSIMLNFLWCVESSNMFISMWYWSKLYNRSLYATLTPLFGVTYIPLRGIALPFLTYSAIASVKQNAALNITMLLMLQAMSSIFAWQLTQILWAKRHTATSLTVNFYRLIKISDPYWFAMVVYYAKLLYNMAFLNFELKHVHPAHALGTAAFLTVDTIHLAISLLYYASDCSMTMERLDFMAIILKIIVNGMVVQRDINALSILIFCVYCVLSASSTFQHALLTRQSRFWFLMLCFLSATHPGFAEFHKHAHYILGYALASVVWVLHIPEALCRHASVFNSLGWMHVLIWLSDQWILRTIAIKNS